MTWVARGGEEKETELPAGCERGCSVSRGFEKCEAAEPKV